MVLGLESSCDDTAAALVQRAPDGRVRVLSAARQGQDADHAAYGGVVPEIAARAHAERLDAVIADALAEAGLSLEDVDAVAATAGPGLIGGVMVALMTGKAIAQARGLSFLAINHLEGHILSPRLSHKVAFPYLALLVSGGHTQLVWVERLGLYERLGSTRDDAVGEAFDKTAKALGLAAPGGPALERLAQDGDPAACVLPRPLKGQPGCDFSFAGLKTAAARAIAALEQDAESRDPARTHADRAHIAAGAQAAIADVLTDRTANALQLVAGRAPTALVVVGGVAANQLIRARLQGLAADAGLDFFAPALEWCTDNGAMIALAGAEHLAAGRTDALDAPARPRWPLDEIAAQSAPVSGAGRKGPKA